MLPLPPTPLIATEQAPGKHGGDRPGTKRKMPSPKGHVAVSTICFRLTFQGPPLSTPFRDLSSTGLTIPKLK